MRKIVGFLTVMLVLLTVLPLFAGNSWWKDQVIPTVVAITSAQGFGSGVIVDSDGYIITNKHVVANDVVYTIYLSNWDEYRGRVVSRHPTVDIAIVKIEPLEELHIAIPGYPEKLELGDEVFALGHPMGIPWTLTKGIVSAFRKTSEYIRYIQTDAPINQGNSGGPLMDEFGRVVGINTLSARGADGLSYAIDIRSFAEWAENTIIIDHEKYQPIE